MATNKVIVHFSFELCGSPGLWKTKIRAHTDTRKTVDHLLDCGCIREVKHDRHCGEAQSSIWSCQMFLLLRRPKFTTSRLQHGFIKLSDGRFLTSVGHEDFHSSVLQQVSPGEDGTDLCEQPFPMKTFCIG